MFTTMSTYTTDVALRGSDDGTAVYSIKCRSAQQYRVSYKEQEIHPVSAMRST